MKIFLVRHGQTDWNIENRLQGCVDIPLNRNGIKQAQILAENIKELKIDRIISSPLSRALDTAKIINKKMQVPLDTSKGLLERSFGILEGIKGTDYDQKLYWNYDKNYRYKNVEPIQGFLNRIYEYLDKLIEENPDSNVLIVTHNGVNIATNCYFYGIPQDKNLLGIKLDNCSYAEYDSDKISNKKQTRNKIEGER